MLTKIARSLGTTVSYLMGEESAPDRISTPNARLITDVTWVPVISDRVKICAGNGNAYPEVEWEIVDHYPFSGKDIQGYNWQGASFLVMSVEGDSMEPIISEGDKVLFAPNIDVSTGDIAIVSLDGSIFIRGVFFNKDNTVTLRARNQEYPDMTIDPQEQDLHIIGKVLRALQDRKIGKIW